MPSAEGAGQGLQGRWVAERLLGLVRPHLEEGDAEPGFYLAIVALARNLKAFLDRLVAADERVYAINARLRELRARRPKRTAAVVKAIDRCATPSELDEALVAKKKAMDGYDEQFLHTARPFESFCLLIGENELAAKVRPSLRRRGRTETPPDGGEGEQEEAAGQAAVPEPGSGVGEEAGAETAEAGSDSAED